MLLTTTSIYKFQLSHMSVELQGPYSCRQNPRQGPKFLTLHNKSVHSSTVTSSTHCPCLHSFNNISTDLCTNIHAYFYSVSIHSYENYLGHFYATRIFHSTLFPDSNKHIIFKYPCKLLTQISRAKRPTNFRPSFFRLPDDILLPPSGHLASFRPWRSFQ